MFNRRARLQNCPPSENESGVTFTIPINSAGPENYNEICPRTESFISLAACTNRRAIADTNSSGTPICGLADWLSM